MQGKKIGQRLIESGYISPEHLKEALEIQKTKSDRICNILIKLGHLGEEDLFDLLSTIPGMATVSLSYHEFNPRILEAVSHELALRLEVIPIDKIGNVLTVAMVCPLDQAGAKELEMATGLEIRPLLSTRRDVLEVLENYYAKVETNKYLSNYDTNPETHSEARLIAGIESLPTVPHVLNMISSIAKDPRSSASELAEVVSTDAALSARILKLANLPAFGKSQTIGDIGQAIDLLGLEKAKRLLSSVPVFHPSSDHGEFDFITYWNHCVACAELARWIAITQESCNANEAYVAGLLHDIGKVVLATKVSPIKIRDEKPDSLRRSRKSRLTMKAREKALGSSHAEVSYFLSENWLLPLSITNAVRYHHMPGLAESSKVLSCIVYLANVFCKMHRSELARKDSFDRGTQDALEVLGFSERTLCKILKAYAAKGSIVLVS